MQRIVATGVANLGLLEEYIKDTWFGVFLFYFFIVGAVGLLRLSKVLHAIWRLVVDVLLGRGRQCLSLWCAVTFPWLTSNLSFV